MLYYQSAPARPRAKGGAALAAVVLKDAEGHGRALAKGVSWRVIGTLDTFLWSLLISHKAFQAGSIASTEILTKVPLYYLHERLWRLVKWAPDSHARSLLKAVSWRFVGGFDTFLRSWLFTGRVEMALSITGAETITKIILYYLHERVWRMVAWGRLEARDAPAVVQPAPGAASTQP
jgi:uncharacterized membrane protein